MLTRLQIKRKEKKKKLHSNYSLVYERLAFEQQFQIRSRWNSSDFRRIEHFYHAAEHRLLLELHRLLRIK